MSESDFPSRIDIAKRVGAASQQESLLLDAPYGCVPMSAAFTHGYSDEHIKNGLALSPSVEQVIKGAEYVARKHDQSVSVHKLSGTDEVTLLESVTPLLEKSSGSWIVYFTNTVSKKIIAHMIGVIQTGPAEFSRWDTVRENKIARMAPQQLIAEIKADMHPQIHDVYCFRFQPKQTYNQ